MNVLMRDAFRLGLWAAALTLASGCGATSTPVESVDSTESPGATSAPDAKGADVTEVTGGTEGEEGTGGGGSGAILTEPEPVPSEPEDLLLPRRTDVVSASGITFRYELLSHKHAVGGGSFGRYAITFTRGEENGRVEFGASNDLDFYGEGDALGFLFQRMGEDTGGKLRLRLHAMPAPALIDDARIDEIMTSLRPEAASGSGRNSVPDGGAYGISFTDLKHCTLLEAVIGAHSGEILFMGTPEDSCPRKGKGKRKGGGKKKGKGEKTGKGVTVLE